MKRDYKDDSFTSRLSSAASAKQASLQRIRAIAQPGHPAFEERRSERQAIAAAREARQAARQAAQAAEEQERALAEEALKIEQKARRDARYAARKASRR